VPQVSPDPRRIPRRSPPHACYLTELSSPNDPFTLTIAMKDNIDPAQLRLKQINSHIQQPKITDYPVRHYASTDPGARLKDKVAIVTGCNSERGIGRATATIFAAAGAKAIVISDLASDNLRKWAEEIGRRYPETTMEWKSFDASGIGQCFGR